MTRSLKSHFSRTLGRQGAPLHFAAHSHHPWPEATFDAQVAYWEDSARDLDGKWEKIFSQVIPEAQRHIAGHLGLPRGDTICFSPNTHDFLLRILWSLPAGRQWRIITTDSEFHSFSRQMARLEEEGQVEVTRVSAAPFDSFVDRFCRALAEGGSWDLVWLSHVFFNTGHALHTTDLDRIAAFVPDEATPIVIDGYHAFMAIPVSLSRLSARAFYLSGGYKYAMAGEGACFMHCPDGYIPRPTATGWFAEFGALESERDGNVAYAPGGARFYGATFDPSGLYRLNAAMDWLVATGQDAGSMAKHSYALQARFLEQLASARVPLSMQDLVQPAQASRGRFLSFRTSRAGLIDARLRERNVIVDHRADLLRIGFSIYQDASDVDALLKTLAELDL